MASTVTRFGYVWCPSCEKIEARTCEVQPLPKCPDCHIFMEPRLCDAVGCDDEATEFHGALTFCSHHHAEELVAA